MHRQHGHEQLLQEQPTCVVRSDVQHAAPSNDFDQVAAGLSALVVHLLK
jgi:hypothetical protein